MFRSHFISKLLFLLVLHNIQCKFLSRNENESPVVETNVGTIMGLRASDGNYNMYMGIPYATVNESNSFGDSIPYPPFEGVFEAYDDTAICPQREEFNLTLVGSLDCLHLNIYVPDTASSENLLPVMVSIHGGGFRIGFAGRFIYGPQYLVRHNVILVTLNYRLGPFGFMCLDIPEVSGNAGLKDQLTALRWIQNNIESFGGDPNKVTLFGNSAGGVSSGLHLISETEKLFSNIIMQSGTHFIGVDEPDQSAPIRLAKVLRYTTNDIHKALSFLETVNALEIIEASSGISFGPCVEKEFPGTERFLSTLAINSNHSKAAGVSVLLGYNSDELMIVFPENAGPSYWFMWEQFLEIPFTYFNFEEVERKELLDIVRRFYIGDEEINDEVRQQLLDLVSDSAFVHSTVRSIEPLLQGGADKVYQYVFSYDGDRNFAKTKDNMTAPGAAHADEVGYLFDVDILPEETTPEDQLILDRFTTLFSNFAKYGDPTPETNTLLPVKWEPITSGSPYHYLEINTEMKAGKRYAHQRMTFLDMLFYAYRKYERGYIDPNQEDEVDEVEESTDSSATIFLSPIIGLIISIIYLSGY